ncbi:hypothetical protein, partial [Bradyrhizobium yuanmingense]|uniref:hypothetical protein n=1 Tax=Bradyrhizobium yuanmingense TaxID=108015 RepID=UPI001AEBED0E
IDRHRIGDPGRRRSRQRHDPEDEGERAAADAEINAGNPLRRRAVPERCKLPFTNPASTSTTASLSAIFCIEAGGGRIDACRDRMPFQLARSSPTSRWIEITITSLLVRRTGWRIVCR